jgi:hypothetical protein
MAVDMAAPVTGFFMLHVLLGVTPVVALSVGAVVPAVRTLYQALRYRRLNAFSTLMLVLLAATLVTVLVTGDARFVLARAAVMPLCGGGYGLVTNFLGRPLVFDVIGPFVTKGDATSLDSWEHCWDHDARFRRRLRLINTIWGVAFIASALTRVVVIYRVGLGVAVVAAQIPTVICVITLAVSTRVLVRPLVEAVRARPAPRVGADRVAAR